jgi:glycosyltransferase involved in cell wall biosynthesis
MKILFIGYMFGRGGIQTHTHFLAEGLAELGHEVVVATPMPIHGHSEIPAYRAEGKYELLRYSGIRGAMKVFGALSCRRFDLVQVCGTGWAAMLGALTAKGQPTLVFFEVMSGDPFRRLDPRWAVHLGFDAIVGQASQVEAKFCRNFKWRGQRATIPALPEPLERCSVIRQRTPLAPGISGKFRGAYFGRLARHKGVQHLVDCWSDLSSCLASVDIYGSGPDEQWIRSKIAEKNLEEFLVLRGDYPSGQEYVDLLQQYDLELLPTTGPEGAPLVLLEAMACGLPFVANGVGGIRDYANKDCEITSGDIGEFAPAVLRWTKRARKGSISPQRMQAHYADSFSSFRLTQRWDSFFTRLVIATNRMHLEHARRSEPNR